MLKLETRPIISQARFVSRSRLLPVIDYSFMVMAPLLVHD
jgi:hypothetical protein